jgi:hypothetical protein
VTGQWKLANQPLTSAVLGHQANALVSLAGDDSLLRHEKAKKCKKNRQLYTFVGGMLY